MEEIWKPVIIENNGVLYNYEELYEVSNLGRVRSLDRIDGYGRELKGKILKLKLDINGYLIITLCKDRKRKTFLVHRLVATAFIPNPDNLPVVNHRDECKTNAVWTNLEWCTYQYNTQYSSYKQKGQKRTEETKQKMSETHSKKVICLETLQVFQSAKAADEWNGLKSGVNKCCRGERKTVGRHPITNEKLHWMYLEDYKRKLRMNIDIKNSQLVA